MQITSIQLDEDKNIAFTTPLSRFKSTTIGLSGGREVKDQCKFLTALANENVPEDNDNFLVHVADDPIISDISKGHLSGIKFVHGSGIVHRDLKPANVLSTNHVNALGQQTVRPIISDLGESISHHDEDCHCRL